MRTLLVAVAVLLLSAAPAAAQGRVRPPFDPSDRPVPLKRYRLRSSERPLTIWFRRKADRPLAQRVARLLESAWRLQVVGLGFRAPTPYDPSGAGRYHVFLERGLGTEVTSVQRVPGAAHDAWETYMTVDAWGEYGGSVLEETVVHEFHHALQAADDWWESPGIFEAGATWVQEKSFPQGDDYLMNVVDFQRRPEWAPDHDDGYATWYMYGASLYLCFLEQRFFAGDPKWLGRVWRGARNPPRPLGDAGLPDPRTNEPDWVDALEAELPAGTSYADTVVAFARWRWYTGRRADGAHFHDGAQLGQAGEVPYVHRAATYPRTITSPGPELLGTHYVLLRRPPSGGDDVGVRLDLSGDPRVRWAVQAVPGLSPGSDGDALAPDGVVRFGALPARALILTAVPAEHGPGSYDPDEHLEGRLRYRLRLDVEAAAPAGVGVAGGLVGGLGN